KAGELPFAISNGASVTTPSGVYALGGVNADGESDKVILLTWNPISRKVEIKEDLPPLPQKCSYNSATFLNNEVYVAGGKNPENPEGMKNFWRLNTSVPTAWEELPAWPGDIRYGTVLTAQHNGRNNCL